MRVLVVTVAGPERVYEDTYPIDTQFTFGHDKLIVGPASDGRIGHYNMPYIISVTAEDRELDSEASTEGRMLGDIP